MQKNVMEFIKIDQAKVMISPGILQSCANPYVL